MQAHVSRAIVENYLEEKFSFIAWNGMEDAPLERFYKIMQVMSNEYREIWTPRAPNWSMNASVRRKPAFKIWDQKSKTCS